ncbi:unnamed protein product, partial [Mesorhabditis belari]|uniref:Uncharacterized protein n=1 Tax=Mesorhabditis belari TaxID=2138241 RepID=A0AAF3FDX5_9BILA
MKNLATILLFLALPQMSAATCPACPTGGVWTGWSRATTCSATCGMNGQVLQKRTCSSYRWGCPCTGAYSRLQKCPNTPCATAPKCATPYTVQAATQKCGPIPADPAPATETCSVAVDACWCPPKGLWSGWKNDGTCTKTCGLCGTVKQERTCLSAEWGCNCTGVATRTKNCPPAPCPTGVECCHAKKPVINLQTNGTVCGPVIADDPVYPNNCRCATCTAASLTKLTASPYSAFTSGVLDKSACYKFNAVCTSLAGHPASIEFNNGDNGVITGTPQVQANIARASDGSGWQYTVGNATVDVSKIGCLSVTCINSPQFCG